MNQSTFQFNIRPSCLSVIQSIHTPRSTHKKNNSISFPKIRFHNNDHCVIPPDPQWIKRQHVAPIASVQSRFSSPAHPVQLIGISMMTFRGMGACVVCVAVMLTLTSTVQAGSSYREKPGSCPLFPAPPPPQDGPLSLGGRADFVPDRNYVTCRSDFDCIGRKKCCPTGACCGTVCTEPWD
ncbi:uncharacterized protein LOC134785692 [Penaeus indicus]|uniref:uncharacterized protein LOC134785692 n=1 Tax=Penaeus indicus TaxID=29960 RepID=UPI00300D0109